MVCRHVICWQLVNGGDDVDNPVLLNTERGLARKVADFRGRAGETAQHVQAEWDAGRSVRTRRSVFSPLDEARVPAWEFCREHEPA